MEVGSSTTIATNSVFQNTTSCGSDENWTCFGTRFCKYDWMMQRQKIKKNFYWTGPKKALDTRVESNLQKSMLVPVNYDDPVKQVKFTAGHKYKFNGWDICPIDLRLVTHFRYPALDQMKFCCSGSFPFPKSEVQVHYPESWAACEWVRRRRWEGSWWASWERQQCLHHQAWPSAWTQDDSL